METRMRFFPNQRCIKAGFRLRGSELVQSTGLMRRAPGLRYLAGQALRHLQGQAVVNFGGWLETFPTGAAARARDSRHGAVRPAAPPNPVALRNVRRVNLFFIGCVDEVAVLRGQNALDLEGDGTRAGWIAG